MLAKSDLKVDYIVQNNQRVLKTMLRSTLLEQFYLRKRDDFTASKEIPMIKQAECGENLGKKEGQVIGSILLKVNFNKER